MKKRILGGFLLGIGVPVTLASLIKLAFAIPSRFALEGEGLLWVARVVETFDLADELLFVALGLCMCLSAIPLFLAPRRRRVPLTVSSAPVSAAGMDSVTPKNLPHPADLGEYVLYTHLVGVEQAMGHHRNGGILSALRPGEPLRCRMVGGKNRPELLDVSTLRGHRLGYLDTAFVRALRQKYPHHRMGLTLARVGGGDGAPYTCEVRVGVYRD